MIAALEEPAVDYKVVLTDVIRRGRNGAHNTWGRALGTIDSSRDLEVARYNVLVEGQGKINGLLFEGLERDEVIEKVSHLRGAYHRVVSDIYVAKVVKNEGVSKEEKK